MAFTYDPTTDIGKVRLLIMDTVTPGQIFEDAEIQAFLDLQEDSIPYAAAQALYSMAANKALVAKRIKVLDIDVDTRQVASELINLADKITEKADNDGSFEIAELVTNQFSWLERIEKQWQRGGL